MKTHPTLRSFLQLHTVLLALWLPNAGAAPPRPGELAGYAADGTLAERIAFAREIGNDRFDEALIARARYNMQRMVMEAQGIDPMTAEEVAGAPPPAWRGMPTTGNVKVLCLLVEFNDYVHNPANTQPMINSALFGAGSAANAPYESLQAYYQRSSYNKLTLQGNTLGWYRTAYNRSAVVQSTTGRENLIKEVLNHYDAQGHDFSQYDNDGDGKVDLIYVIWAGPDNGWANFWWAYQTSWSDQTYVKDGKRFGKYVWQFQNYNIADPFTPRVIIHETGHALGLPDFYDYDGNVGPDGGVGGLDMMDGNQGDHNCFSKWILGWLTPTVVASGSQNRALRASGTSEDCIMIIPGASVSGQYSEFFMVQNRTRFGNDNAADWPGAGMMIWHIDSTLDGSGQNYLYNNSYTAHKLLRLMEADGLQQIENNQGGNAGDYYALGRSFTVSSTPNSRRYDGSDSRVSINNFTASAQTMNAQFTIVGTGNPPTVSITSPTAGFTTPQGTTINVAANAADDASVVSVAFYRDGALISTDTSAPYAAAWSGATPGNHILTAVATDNEGLSTTSAGVAITVTSINPPGNDNFASRFTIVGNVATVSGSNVNATVEASEPNHAAQTPRRSVWWTWTPSITGTATVSTTNSSYDTILAAYTGSALGSLVVKAANDDVGGGVYTSLIIFPVTAGVPIQIAVDGYNGDSGTISLRVAAVFNPPANDPFAGAITIPNSTATATVTGSNNGATIQAGEPAHAGFGPFHSVWWKWTAPSAGTLEVSTQGSNFDTLLAVYTGAAVNALTARASNDDTVGRTSYVSLPVIAGVTYYIAVDGYAGAAGDITVQTHFSDVNDPPTVGLISPVQGQSIRTNTPLYLLAEAYDPEGTVREVRFYVNGVLVATVPSVPEQVTYAAQHLITAAGYYAVTAIAEDNLGLKATNSVTVLASAISLPEALNNFELPWISGGSQHWFGTAANSHDGVSSALSGDIADSEQSWFSTTVTGPGNISFWWSVSSEADYDYLIFYVDGVAQTGSISGSVAWQQKSYNIAAGTHTLRWEYNKDSSLSHGADAAWVDEAVWVTPPQIYGASSVTAPTGVPLNYLLYSIGGHVTFSVQTGTLPPGLTLNAGTGAITGSPTTAGTYNVVLRGANAAGASTLPVAFTIFNSLPIPDSVDTPGLLFSSGGNSRWFGQTTVTHDGVDAAQSGVMVDSQSTWMQTSITGPGTLTFWWKVSSEANYDFLFFTLDGVVQDGAAGISGNVDWQQKTIAVPDGTHVLQWAYAKDASVSVGTDAGWVDQVVFAPTLPVALDTPALAWSTSGDANWDGQILVSHDGVDAARSGAMTHDEACSMQTSVTGDGVLSFWWRVSSEANYDYLRFYLDGVEQPGVVGISGEVGWQQITVAVPAGAHTLRWTYSKDGTVNSGADAAWVDQVVFAPSLPVALDTPGRAWTTAGNANWAGQTLVSHDGVDAARSGALTHNQQSRLESIFTGPGVLSFWWKVSSEDYFDYLRFYLDGVEQPGAVGISGEVGWQPITVTVPAGTHAATWVYSKDLSVNLGADAGWVDQVVFAPSGPIALASPRVLADGSIQLAFSNLAGVPFTVLASTDASLPLTQWTAIGIPTEDPPGQYQFTDTQATDGAQRFYAIALGQDRLRWASRVLGFSSQWSTGDWSSAQALGRPDTYPAYGDIGTAWAPLNQDDPGEYIELGFDAPAPITSVSIYETHAPGAVSRISVRNPGTGLWVVLWSGPAAPAAPVARIFTVTFPRTTFPVDTVRIELDSPAVPSWNELDAISINR